MSYSSYNDEYVDQERYEYLKRMYYKEEERKKNMNTVVEKEVVIDVSSNQEIKDIDSSKKINKTFID